MVNWKGFVMDNNTSTITGNAAEGENKATQTGAANGSNTADTQSADETVTMSKADYDKAIQAAEDRLRTKYSKNIKALEDKIAALTPVEKTDAERDFEKRLADLEKKEQENEVKAKVLNLKAVLQSHNIDSGIADYLSADVDAEAFSADIEKIISARLAAGGYKPTGHQTNQPITKAEYDKMTYDERADLYRRDPETWKRLKI